MNRRPNAHSASAFALAPGARAGRGGIAGGIDFPIRLTERWHVRVASTRTAVGASRRCINSHEALLQIRLGGRHG